MPSIIDKDKCTACGVCVNVCPQDVYWGSEKKKTQDVYWGSEKKKTPVVSYPEECWHCGACVLDCPVEGAIRLRIPLPLSICYK